MIQRQNCERRVPSDVGVGSCNYYVAGCTIVRFVRMSTCAQMHSFQFQFNQHQRALLLVSNSLEFGC